MSKEDLVSIYDILQNFIQSMAHVQIAISIRWTIMKNKASLPKKTSKYTK